MMCDEEQDLDPTVWKPLLLTKEDAAWQDMQYAIAQDICRAFGVSPQELGFIADSNTSFSERYLELSFQEILSRLPLPLYFLPEPQP